MALVVLGLLGMWIVAPLVTMSSGDALLGWLTFAVAGAATVMGGVSELWP